MCTFCGAKVALDYKERIAQQAAAAADGSGPSPSTDPDMAFGLTEGEESAATAAAVAFKDRLVEYDRNSAKRTTVIDDQSDYFEIDANAWLTDEVSERKGAGDAKAIKRMPTTGHLCSLKHLAVDYLLLYCLCNATSAALCPLF